MSSARKRKSAPPVSSGSPSKRLRKVAEASKKRGQGGRFEKKVADPIAKDAEDEEGEEDGA
jgi:hypothetical protein